MYRSFAKLLAPQHRPFSTPSFKSAISLDNLYPQSSLKLTSPTEPPNDGGFSGFIPMDQIDVTYSRSSGPGGQNVNKVNTKVEVRFELNSAKWISDEIKNRLFNKYKNKLTKDGFLIFRSDLTRSQQMNLADCLEKIRTSVRSCMIEEELPSQETQEKMRRRLERASQERLMIKRERSQVKSDRQAPEVRL